MATNRTEKELEGRPWQPVLVILSQGTIQNNGKKVKMLWIKNVYVIPDFQSIYVPKMYNIM